MSFVVDASVALKWVIAEEDRAAARAFLDRHRLSDLSAPDLLIAEVSNVIWKKCTRGEITRLQAAEAGLQIRSVIPRLVPSRLLNRSAIDIALELGHPVYDCFYIACAQLMRGSLVTLDQRLIDKLSRTRFASRIASLRSVH